MASAPSDDLFDHIVEVTNEEPGNALVTYHGVELAALHRHRRPAPLREPAG